MAKKTTTATAMVNRLAKLASGWTVGKGKGYHDGSQVWPDENFNWLSFTRGGVTVALNVTEPTTKWDRDGSYEDLLVEGHTSFDGRCFTRHGVDTCSCSLTSSAKVRSWNEHAYADLASLLAGEEARCAAARKRAATAVPVPGLPFHVQPTWFASAADALRHGRPVQLTPHGFGTGYHLSVQPRRYAVRADPALEAKLDVGPVYVSTFDHD